MPNREITFQCPQVAHVCGISLKRAKKLAGATISIVDIKKASLKTGTTNTWQANLSAPGSPRKMVRWIAYDDLGNVLAVVSRMF